MTLVPWAHCIGSEITCGWTYIYNYASMYVERLWPIQQILQHDLRGIARSLMIDAKSSIVIFISWPMLKTLTTAVAGSKEAQECKQNGTTMIFSETWVFLSESEPCLISTAQSAGECMRILHSLRNDRHVSR